MNTQYKLQHLGFPVANRSVDESEWKLLSTHKTWTAAFKRISKEKAHLSPGCWDDHYRVVDSNGDVVPVDKWLNFRHEQEYRRDILKDIRRGWKARQTR